MARLDHVSSGGYEGIRKWRASGAARLRSCFVADEAEMFFVHTVLAMAFDLSRLFIKTSQLP